MITVAVNVNGNLLTVQCMTSGSRMLTNTRGCIAIIHNQMMYSSLTIHEMPIQDSENHTESLNLMLRNGNYFLAVFSWNDEGIIGSTVIWRDLIEIDESKDSRLFSTVSKIPVSKILPLIHMHAV